MTITLTTRQQAVIDAAKKVSWRFRVTDRLGNVFFWSTKNIAGDTAGVVWNVETDETYWAADVAWEDDHWGIDIIDDDQWIGDVHWAAEEHGQSYDFKIVDFDGVELRRTSKESGIVAPNDLTFTVLNAGKERRPHA